MCLSIIACLCPPLAVCFKRGCGVNFCVTILLTLLGWIPGCCFACHIIHKEGKSRGNVTQITNVQMAAAQPAHVTVNLPSQQQYPSVHGAQYNPNPNNLYHQQHSMNVYPHIPSPTNVPPPPPMYSNASAPAPPPYYYGDQQGQGDNNIQK